MHVHEVLQFLQGCHGFRASSAAYVERGCRSAPAHGVCPVLALEQMPQERGGKGVTRAKRFACLHLKHTLCQGRAIAQKCTTTSPSILDHSGLCHTVQHLLRACYGREANPAQALRQLQQSLPALRRHGARQATHQPHGLRPLNPGQEKDFP